MGEIPTGNDTVTTEIDETAIDASTQPALENRFFLFDEQMDSLTDAEEKAQAQFYLSYYNRWKALSKTNVRGFLEVYQIYSDFFEDLSEQDQEEVRKCKIFHLFSGSTMHEDQWKSIPMTDKGGVLKNFIDTKILPLIEQYEKEQSV